MPDAKASGADAGAARSREHNQGNQGRSYTVEQKAAVLRIRRCNATAFYDILGLETVRSTCTETEIKKAYRKQSLLTHPDKNGHEHAAEAFKMVSRAFGILGDKEKKEKYDRHGTDPDSRFANAQNSTPGFNGFGRRADGFGGHGHPFGAGGGEEMTPEEMFARFFGGGGGFGGGPFGGGGGESHSNGAVLAQFAQDAIVQQDNLLTTQVLIQALDSFSTLAAALVSACTNLVVLALADDLQKPTSKTTARPDYKTCWASFPSSCFSSSLSSHLSSPVAATQCHTRPG